MNSWKDYQNLHQERFLQELLELLRIPSVSARSENKTDMHTCAELVQKRLREAGADRAEIFQTPGHPIVFAEKIIDPSRPTVLVYGHYDVQPADPLELWTTPPFEPTIRDGKIFARGACDDKGQFYMHVKALEIMTATGTLPVNIKFLIEGEEEVGSSHLSDFVKNNKSLLQADVILISDTSMLSMDTPSIDVGVRGLSYIEVEVTGPNRDLPFDEEEYKKDLGIPAVWGEKGYSTHERTGIRPTLEVNGIWGGYTGEGSKTVLPSKAFAKISCRLVPNQTSQKITDKLIAYFQSIAPQGVTVKATEHHGGEPYLTPIDSHAYRSAAKAIAQTFGKEPIPVRGGGSIPICALFEKELGLKIVFMGFGLDSDNLHSPNEKYDLFNFYKGIETIPYFHLYFSEKK